MPFWHTLRRKKTADNKDHDEVRWRDALPGGRVCRKNKSPADKKAKKGQRRQKQPNGNAMRRRAPKRRRTVLQRLAEKNILNPDRCFGCQRKAALNQGVKRALAMPPAQEENVGLSGRQGGSS